MTIKTCYTPREAMDFARRSDGEYTAVYMDGHKAMPTSEICMLDESDVEYALLCECDGKILTVPYR